MINTKIKKILVSFALLLFFVPNLVLADGAMMYYDPYDDHWGFSDETYQKAFIAHKDGFQKMLLSVEFTDTEENAVWMFPVPAEPDVVVLDILDQLPKVNGINILDKARSSLRVIKEVTYGSQIYPAIFSFMTSQLGYATMSSGEAMSLGGKAAGYGANGVSVYEHIEKEGMVSELITAKDADSIYNYLAEKGLQIEKGVIPPLDHYIGQDYSFVVSWLDSAEHEITSEYIKDNLELYFSDQDTFYKFYVLTWDMMFKYQEFEESYSKLNFLKDPQNQHILDELVEEIRRDPSIINYIEVEEEVEEDNDIDGTDLFGIYSEPVDDINRKAVSIIFPSEEAYFPLVLTSVYGSKVVPADVRIAGHVSPRIFDSIQNFTEVNYFYVYRVGQEFSDQFENFYKPYRKHSVKYTQIKIDAPSKLLTEDLWVDSKVPFWTRIVSFIGVHRFIVGAVIFLVASILSGILAGMIVFRDMRSRLFKLGLLGVTNILTIISVIFFTFFSRTKNTNQEAEDIISVIKEKKYFFRRKLSTIIFIFNLPFLFTSILYSFQLVFEPIARVMPVSYYIISVLLILIPFLVLLLSLVMRRVKKEDKELFIRLKSLHYSMSTLLPKDKKKLLFIPLYSVTFLILVFLMVGAIGLLV